MALQLFFPQSQAAAREKRTGRSLRQLPAACKKVLSQNAARREKRGRGGYQPPGRAGLKQHKNVRRIRTYLRMRLTFLTF